MKLSDIQKASAEIEKNIFSIMETKMNLCVIDDVVEADVQKYNKIIKRYAEKIKTNTAIVNDWAHSIIIGVK